MLLQILISYNQSKVHRRLSIEDLTASARSLSVSQSRLRRSGKKKSLNTENNTKSLISISIHSFLPTVMERKPSTQNLTTLPGHAGKALWNAEMYFPLVLFIVSISGRDHPFRAAQAGVVGKYKHYFFSLIKKLWCSLTLMIILRCEDKMLSLHI